MTSTKEIKEKWTKTIDQIEELKDVDMTDTWMNPDMGSFTVSSPVYENKTEYFIERCRRQICYGNPGYIDEWATWSVYDTAKERDEELKKLHVKHPMWHLRARDRNRYLESRGIFAGISQPGINK